MYKIKITACLALISYALMQHGMINEIPDIEQQRFIYAIDRTERAPLLVSQIEQAIMAHMFRRKMNNWIFTDTRVHSATLQALHAYTSLSDQDRMKNAQQMQMLLNSHANFLYDPFCWNDCKHVELVDGFIYSTTGKRMELSALDRIPIRVSGGTTPVPIIISKPNRTSDEK